MVLEQKPSMTRMHVTCAAMAVVAAARHGFVVFGTPLMDVYTALLS
jgi:hypothetical protein